MWWPEPSLLTPIFKLCNSRTTIAPNPFGSLPLENRIDKPLLFFFANIDGLYPVCAGGELDLHPVACAG